MYCLPCSWLRHRHSATPWLARSGMLLHRERVLDISIIIIITMDLRKDCLGCACTVFLLRLSLNKSDMTPLACKRQGAPSEPVCPSKLLHLCLAINLAQVTWISHACVMELQSC